MAGGKKRKLSVPARGSGHRYRVPPAVRDKDNRYLLSVIREAVIVFDTADPSIGEKLGAAQSILDTFGHWLREMEEPEAAAAAFESAIALEP